MMLKTAHLRLQQIRRETGYSQPQMAAVMEVKSQSNYSRKENGTRPITPEEGALIERKLGYRAEWLFYEKGPERLDGFAETKEPETGYIVQAAKTEMDWSVTGIRIRFLEQLEKFRTENDMNLVEAAEKLKLPFQHLSNLRYGQREVSTVMLTNALRYGRFNLQYTIGGIGGLFADSKMKKDTADMEQSKEVLRLKNRNQELEEMVAMQRLVIDKIGTEKKSA